MLVLSNGQNWKNLTKKSPKVTFYLATFYITRGSNGIVSFILVFLNISFIYVSIGN